MLNFMNENSKFDNDEENASSQGQVSNEQTNAGQIQEDDYLTTSVDKSNVKRSTMILAAIFVIGAGAILLMIKNVCPQSANAASVAKAENELDMAIARLSGIKAEIFQKMDSIAKKFDEYSNIEQVNVSQLRKDPFRNQYANSSSRNDGQSSGTQSSGGYLQLDSIIQSDDGNFCMIDGKVLKEGDVVDGYTVKVIEKNFVKLESNGDVKILKIDML
jgi:hypothetical protein